jgi:hypothetical protein
MHSEARLRANGTLGGEHITGKSTIGKLEFVLDATKFDCAKLAERRATLKDPPPARADHFGGDQ